MLFPSCRTCKHFGWVVNAIPHPGETIAERKDKGVCTHPEVNYHFGYEAPRWLVGAIKYGNYHKLRLPFHQCGVFGKLHEPRKEQ